MSSQIKPKFWDENILLHQDDKPCVISAGIAATWWGAVCSPVIFVVNRDLNQWQFIYHADNKITIVWLDKMILP